MSFVLQTNNTRSSWDAVWMAPEEIAKEGIMISPHLLDDHYTVTLEVQYLCPFVQLHVSCFGSIGVWLNHIQLGLITSQFGRSFATFWPQTVALTVKAVSCTISLLLKRS